MIDMQRAFLDPLPATSPPLEVALRAIEAAARSCRAAGAPVVWVQDHDSVAPGEPGFELLAVLTPEPGDLRLIKREGDAFAQPALAAWLRGRAVEEVVLAGFRAEACVRASAAGAEAAGFRVRLLAEGVLSTSAGALTEVCATRRCWKPG